MAEEKSFDQYLWILKKVANEKEREKEGKEEKRGVPT
jgi:hypothetical protein